MDIGRRLKRWLHWGPLLGIFVTVYIYIAITKWVIPWQSLLSSKRADQWLILSFEFAEFFYMLIVIFRDPGFVPYRWTPPPFAVSKLTKCSVCQETRKPPRAHHCKTCGRCVRKMDHHCPYINNCVGHGNQRAFMMYVLTTTTICHFTAAWSGWRLVYDANASPYALAKSIALGEWVESVSSFDYYAMWGLLLCFALSILFALGTAYLLVAQLLAIGRNQTTLESWAMPRYFDYQRGIARSSNDYVGNPYDLGYWQNWLPVLGNSMVKWLLPIWSNEGSGLDFQVRDDCIMYRYEEYCTRVAQLVKQQREQDEQEEQEQKNKKET